MINPKRIAELREWLTNILACSYIRVEYRVVYTDLLAFLSDYEAALPLLEAAKKAVPPPKKEGAEKFGAVFMWETDEDDILESALAYKERSGG